MSLSSTTTARRTTRWSPGQSAFSPLGISFHGGARLSYTVSHDVEQLFSPFKIHAGIQIPVDRYAFVRQTFSYQGPTNRRLSYKVSYDRGGFYTGSSDQLDATLSWRQSAHRHNRSRVPAVLGPARGRGLQHFAGDTSLQLLLQLEDSPHELRSVRHRHQERGPAEPAALDHQPRTGGLPGVQPRVAGEPVRQIRGASQRHACQGELHGAVLARLCQTRRTGADGSEPRRGEPSWKNAFGPSPDERCVPCVGPRRLLRYRSRPASSGYPISRTTRLKALSDSDGTTIREPSALTVHKGFVRLSRASSRPTSASAHSISRACPVIDRMERRSELYIGTLRKFIEAMNGELVLAARFDDGVEVPIRLTEAEDAA